MGLRRSTMVVTVLARKDWSAGVASSGQGCQLTLCAKRRETPTWPSAAEEHSGLEFGRLRQERRDIAKVEEFLELMLLGGHDTDAGNSNIKKLLDSRAQTLSPSGWFLKRDRCVKMLDVYIGHLRRARMLVSQLWRLSAADGRGSVSSSSVVWGTRG